MFSVFYNYYNTYNTKCKHIFQFHKTFTKVSALAFFGRVPFEETHDAPQKEKQTKYYLARFMFIKYSLWIPKWVSFHPGF